MNKKIFLILFFLPLSFISYSQFRVVGYLPNWGNFVNNANNIDYSKITHLNIAFLNPTDATGNLGPTAGLSTVVTKAHENNVFILASLGGAGVPAHYSTLLQDANRPGFINKIVDLVNLYNLDGIDVDLEGSAIDANYEKFVTDLKDTLSKINKLTTAAIATWVSGQITAGALAQFDFVNIMSYDATGPWAPGYPGPHSPYSMAVNDLYHWGTTRGVPKDKMVLGVPFYGYNFGASGYPTSLTFNDIVNNFPGSEENDQVSVNGGNIYYNGIPTIKSKTQLALSDAGGIMIWQLAQDATGANSLLSVIDMIVKSANTNIFPTVQITSPANQSVFTDADTITITADANDSDGSIYKVMFFAGNIKIGEDFTAPYSIDWIGAGAGTYYITARALDNFFATTVSDNDTIIVNNSPVQLAFGGIPWPIPGKIEAENFDVGGQNNAYYDNTTGNTGGYYRTTRVDIEPCSDAGGGFNVGWIAPGEWLEYTVMVETTDQYHIFVRVATTLSGKQFHFKLDGTDITGLVNVPNTGGWQTWSTVTIPNISLTEGTYVLRLHFNAGDFNVNHFQFVPSIIAGNIPKKDKLSLIAYPNPSKEHITIEYNNDKPTATRISLYNIYGVEVRAWKEEIASGLIKQSLSLQGLEEGIYVCKIENEWGERTIKIVKE